MEMLVLPALFSDSGEPPFEPQEIEEALFAFTGNTVPRYFLENSRGAFVAYGDVAPWVRTSVTLMDAAGSVNGHGLWGPRMRDYMREAVHLADPHVDFGDYDNDGPDGIPNSGDDDGVVDAVNIEFAEPAGSCPGGPGIWPHFSVLNEETDDLRPDGTPIAVGPYFAESTTECDGVSIQSPGTVAHEFGHRLGLPDYYRVPAGGDILPSERHWNIGCFGIMGAGGWGCGSGPTGTDFGPTNLSPLSKAQLGWVTPLTVPPVRNAEYYLNPVQSSGDVLRLTLDPEGNEYLLVEYRLQTGFDRDLPGSGVLVYHVDHLYQTRESAPGEPIPYYHYLVEADGDYELRRVEADGGNRGEAEDMFAWDGRKGSVGQFEMPWTRSHSGETTPVVIHSIERDGMGARLRITTHPIPGVGSEADSLDLPVLTSVSREIPVYGGIPPYEVSVPPTSPLPTGLDLVAEGNRLILSGTPTRIEDGQFEMQMLDAAGNQGTAQVSVLVQDLDLPVSDLIRLAAGADLELPDAAYLDANGNGNGELDLGDVRAYLERTGRWFSK
jgi:M6 family metalloprotease-like protein